MVKVPSPLELMAYPVLASKATPSDPAPIAGDAMTLPASGSDTAITRLPHTENGGVVRSAIADKSAIHAKRKREAVHAGRTRNIAHNLARIRMDANHMGRVREVQTARVVVDLEKVPAAIAADLDFFKNLPT